MQFVRIFFAAKYFTARIPAAVQGYDLGAHVPFDDVADFNVMTVAVLRTPDVLFGHQRRIGRYAVQNAQFMRLANLLQIGCVDEEFHGSIGFRFP